MDSEKERQFSAAQSSHVNTAYHVLRSPLTRGQYLLSLRGEDTDHVALTPDFLLEVMELNEELESATGPAVLTLRASIAERVRECENWAAEAFAKDDLNFAKIVLAQMKYFCNLEQNIRDNLA